MAKKKKWIVYPEVELTLNDIKEHYMKKEKKEKEVVTLEDVALPEVNNLPQNEPIIGDLNETILTEEEINSAMELGDGIASEEPIEEKELTDEEKKAIFIQNLKNFHKNNHNFRPIKQVGKYTTNQFGIDYKKKRQKKNKIQRKSRKLNKA